MYFLGDNGSSEDKPDELIPIIFNDNKAKEAKGKDDKTKKNTAVALKTKKKPILATAKVFIIAW